MAQFKEMPISKKYICVSHSIKRATIYVPLFLKQCLGEDAAGELQNIWRIGMKLGSANLSIEEKFELTYANWIWMAKNTYSFIRSKLGAEGIQQFEHAEVDMLKREGTGLSLLLLRMMRVLSPGLAFSLVAKQIAYQLQWLTPIQVHEATRYKLVVKIPSCRILHFPSTDDLCSIGCQSTYETWFAEQLGIRMQTVRQDKGCTKRLTPFR
jgi:hypothetical protein